MTNQEITDATRYYDLANMVQRCGDNLMKATPEGDREANVLLGQIADFCLDWQERRVGAERAEDEIIDGRSELWQRMERAKGTTNPGTRAVVIQSGRQLTDYDELPEYDEPFVWE